MAKTKHELLYDAAKEAIDSLHGDRSVSPETTLESLNTLIGELEIMCEALQYDIDKLESGDD